MPDMDGFAACARVRALPGGADLPIIFLTALRDVDTFDRALEVGGDDFLTKPVRPGELVARVESALKLRKMRVELREHYELLRRQRDDLLRVQLQKERLMAFVVHDLKGPVNAMDLNAQLLSRDPSLSDSARKAVGQIRNEARQLNRMILNLLDISKADEGKLSVERRKLDLVPLIAELFSEFTPMAEMRRVRLDSNLVAREAFADPDLLKRVLMNFIENAVRHTAVDSSVTVASQKAAGAVELSVLDRGPGIPPGQKERIFDAFVQGATGVTRSGRGLGLAFCRAAATAHGGRVWVQDAEPGASFHVSLPNE